MIEHQQNIRANKLAAKLIKIGRDDFDLDISLSLQNLVERIKNKRGVSSQAARKIARELLRAS